MKKVAVIFGGEACEREISIITGTFTCNVLRGGKYSVLPVFLDEKKRAYTSEYFFEIGAFKEKDFLKKSKQIIIKGGTVYALNDNSKRLKRLCVLMGAINCCHGGFGEGGGVSAWMEMQGVPLASPPMAPSAICLDKALTKVMAKGLNIPTVDGMRVRECDYRHRGEFLLKNISRWLKFPVIIKPAHLGSSIGIRVAKDEAETKQAIEAAFQLDNCVLIERFLEDKRDVNCAAYSLGDEVYVSEVEEAFSAANCVYGFQEKYLKKEQKSGGRVLLSGILRQKIRCYTRTIYKKLNMAGVVRVDYLVQGDKVYLSEVNTVPGSLAYYLFCDRISEAKNFFEALLDDAILKSETERKQSISTGILDSIAK